jgi:hypothetical protein
MDSDCHFRLGFWNCFFNRIVGIAMKLIRKKKDEQTSNACKIGWTTWFILVLKELILETQI